MKPFFDTADSSAGALLLPLAALRLREGRSDLGWPGPAGLGWAQQVSGARAATLLLKRRTRKRDVSVDRPSIVKRRFAGPPVSDPSQCTSTMLGSEFGLLQIQEGPEPAQFHQIVLEKKMVNPDLKSLFKNLSKSIFLVRTGLRKFGFESK